jgi:hypothetical protein
MKFIFLTILLFSGLVTVAQEAAEKRVTVLLSNISLEKALTVLSISYNVQFSYSDDVVAMETLVNLSIENQTLTEALDEVLTPHAIAYKIVNASRVVLRRKTVALTQIVRGVVVDEVTGAPIPGATLVVAETEPAKGTTTNANGYFEIANVPIGRRTFEVRSIGYVPRSISAILLVSGKECFLNVALSESVTAMNEVIVTAAKDDAIPADGAAVTSGRTFSVEETKRYAGSMGDPARMATGFAGVTPTSDENNALVVRGNSPRGVLWRVEGVEIPNPNHFSSEGPPVAL